MSIESENIKIANLIRLSRKNRKKKLKRTHKSILVGGRKSVSKENNKNKSGLKKSLLKTSTSPPKEEDKDDNEVILEIECEVISYGGVKYLLDKKNNIYSYPDENEQYFLVGKKVNDYIKFDKKYKDMIDSK